MLNLNELINFDYLNAIMAASPNEELSEDSQHMLGGGDMRGGEITYNLVKTSRKCNRYFDMEQTTFTYTINNNIEQASLFEAVINFRNFFEQFVTDNIASLPDNRKVKVMFFHPSFDSPVNSYYIDKPQFTADLIVKLFYNVVQSRKNANKMQLTDRDQLDIILSIAKTTNGCGRAKKRPLEEILNTNYVSYKEHKTLREYCRETPCMLSCEDDNFCLLRSIFLGKMMHEDPKLFRNYNNPKFKTTQLAY